MLNINFEGKVRFYKLINLSIANNIDIYALLQTALLKNDREMHFESFYKVRWHR